jgi:hypothetical protein
VAPHEASLIAVETTITPQTTLPGWVPRSIPEAVAMSATAVYLHTATTKYPACLKATWYV